MCARQVGEDRQLVGLGASTAGVATRGRHQGTDVGRGGAEVGGEKGDFLLVALATWKTSLARIWAGNVFAVAVRRSRRCHHHRHTWGIALWPRTRILTKTLLPGCDSSRVLRHRLLLFCGYRLLLFCATAA
jgi:hypothetical protein